MEHGIGQIYLDGQQAKSTFPSLLKLQHGFNIHKVFLRNKHIFKKNPKEYSHIKYPHINEPTGNDQRLHIQETCTEYNCAVTSAYSGINMGWLRPPSNYPLFRQTSDPRWVCLDNFVLSFQSSGSFQQENILRWWHVRAGPHVECEYL